MSLTRRSNHSDPEKAARPGIPFLEVARIIFVFPHMLLLLLRTDWRRAVVRVAVVCFICGLVVGVSQAVIVRRGMNAWAEWLRDNVETVEVADGRLSWEQPEGASATKFFRGWRIDFRRSPDNAFERRSPPGTYPRGVWATPSVLLLWWRVDDADKVQVQTLFKDGEWQWIGQAAQMISDPSEPLRVSGREFDQHARKAMWMLLPMMLILQGVIVAGQVLLYAALFAIIPFLLRSPLAAGGFGSILAFYLYASLPAVVVATVYAGIGIRALDFNTIFVTVFIAYLIFALWRLGRATRPSTPDRH